MGKQGRQFQRQGGFLKRRDKSGEKALEEGRALKRRMVALPG